MSKKEFSLLWHKWMKECTGTTTISVLVNDNPTEKFPLERVEARRPFFFFLLLATEGLNIMTHVLVNKNLFKSYQVDMSESISISHLQIAVNTLILEEKCWTIVRAMQAVLFLFELISGLKVNFNKSLWQELMLTTRSWQAAYVLNCRIDCLPFVYLGLSIGVMCDD